MATRRYQLAVLSTLMLAVLVVGLGAYTRLTEAGLGCPDWPGCYGHLGVPASDSAQSVAMSRFPDAPLDINKAWNEMLHRYVAGTLGLAIFALAGISWRRPDYQALRPLTTLLSVVVIAQAALGMWTVTLSLMPVVVMAHLLGGFTTVCLLVWLAVATGALRLPAIAVSSSARRVGTLALVAVIIQIGLGGWTSANYAATVCTQLPICESPWWQLFTPSAFHPVSPLSDTYQFGVLNHAERVTIHATHRLGAMVVTALVLAWVWGLWRAGARALAMSVSAVLAIQITLGVTNVVALLPLSVAVAHNLGGLSLLATLLLTRFLCLSASTRQGARDGTVSTYR
ncbi:MULTISPECIES: heme A synthase [unclassified Salinivibrio]|uniref:COX15/CtaA family protein n=1 Tax=unclassified Salinivibrio TaxID=2636825 RepID=UPI00128B9FA3|nr:MULTISPECIES: COX15/CtaA family protein [unclassified Salinivibrio]MPS32581.1 heme A synthase [Salinivibrio sp. VYel7]MPX93972.1 heme A synthase [Salinivibrio sp. VYel9]MPX96687.1 heme A synthase [Salinivibrio sp. VYel6]MPY00168.1 heme A synthase [Salinivibrio sp. VYel4]MPY03236.1 heme A synthase [Salinivibrio sp. VYel5]